MVAKVLSLLLVVFVLAALLDGLCYLLYGGWMHEAARIKAEHKRFGRTLLAIAACEVHSDPTSFFATEAQAMKRWAAEALDPKAAELRQVPPVIKQVEAMRQKTGLTK